MTGVQATPTLTVIYDSGNTRPISDYLPKRPVAKTARQENHSKGREPEKKLAYRLPITTPSMQPGAVKTNTAALRYLHRPLFLIGSDALSQKWLTERRGQLRKIGAVGLLIEARNQGDVDRMVTLADGLPLIPASAESFVERLGLSHYPVLLSKSGWEQ